MKGIHFGVLTMFVASIAYAETLGETLNKQGVELGREGKFRDAIVFFDRAIAVEPNYAEPFYKSWQG